MKELLPHLHLQDLEDFHSSSFWVVVEENEKDYWRSYCLRHLELEVVLSGIHLEESEMQSD